MAMSGPRSVTQTVTNGGEIRTKVEKGTWRQ